MNTLPYKCGERLGQLSGDEMEELKKAVEEIKADVKVIKADVKEGKVFQNNHLAHHENVEKEQVEWQENINDIIDGAKGFLEKFGGKKYVAAALGGLLTISTAALYLAQILQVFLGG